VSPNGLAIQSDSQRPICRDLVTSLSESCRGLNETHGWKVPKVRESVEKLWPENDVESTFEIFHTDKVTNWVPEKHVPRKITVLSLVMPMRSLFR